MIDIHELRIGNLVYAYPFRIIKVSEITNLKSVLNEGDESEEPFADEELDGIPLTPEILEKCGFRKVVGWYENIEMYGAFEFTNDGCFELSDGEDRPICKIRFVHQLQNLYFTLTGIELEINLTE